MDSDIFSEFHFWLLSSMNLYWNVGYGTAGDMLRSDRLKHTKPQDVLLKKEVPSPLRATLLQLGTYPRRFPPKNSNPNDRFWKRHFSTLTHECSAGIASLSRQVLQQIHLLPAVKALPFAHSMRILSLIPSYQSNIMNALELPINCEKLRPSLPQP